MTEAPLTGADTPNADRRHREDRRQTATGGGDLLQRIECKVAAIQAESRRAPRRQTDVIIGRVERRTTADESAEAVGWQHEAVSERLRLLSHYGIT